ncbi:hypothetical protein ACEWY4_025013 [Coilia grayii]|uniref:Ubiquitin-like domain-containing protein n=1 Tax=Coilia grayii TaxID=363190 RepID=A0ABD1IXD2_9TELE
MGAAYSYFFETASENATFENTTTSAPAPTQTSSNATAEDSTVSTQAPTQPVESGYDNTFAPDTWHSSPNSSFEEEDVDKRNIIVKSNGKSQQVDVFPDEKMSVLKKEACELFQKKEQWMKIVYKGEELDINKTIRECHLRAGSTVNLIRAA